jgi:ubiquitin-protein ligase
MPVYPDGRVCISILHPPGEDPNGYELASERWTPVHTVRLRILCLHTLLKVTVIHHQNNIQKFTGKSVIMNVVNCQ